MKTRLLMIATLAAAFFAHAQLASINENFNSFSIDGDFPQNGWEISSDGPMMWVDGDGVDNYVEFYAFFYPNTPGYLISPQIVAPNGTQTLSFTPAQTPGSAGVGTIQAGLVSGNTAADMASFTPIGDEITLTSTTDQTYTFNVPASSYQYIAFKFVGNIAHAALQVDDVILTPSLGVSESSFNKDNLKFALTADKNSLVFVSKSIIPTKAKIYSESGQLAAQGKISNNSFDISNLETGVYFIVIEDVNGKLIKSKFIK